jgi:hypothetical protein
MNRKNQDSIRVINVKSYAGIIVGAVLAITTVYAWFAG